MTSVGTVIDFDHHSPEFAQHRDEILADLRAGSPIAWTERYGGFWVITSHALITQVMRDDVRFTVERTAAGRGGITIPESVNRLAILPGEVDGTPHEIYRRALSPFFAKVRVEAMAEDIRRIVDNLIDEMTERGQFDAYMDFAREIPMRAVYRYMGIEVDDRWGLFDSIEEARRQPTEEFVGDVADRLGAIIADKRANKPDDLLGWITALEEPRFSDADLLSLCVGLILGGVRTTGDLLGHSLLGLELDPDLRRQLTDDPSLIPAAVVEFVRLATPAVGLARTALEDVEIGGVTIRAGDRILNVFYSGNRDEAAFPRADKIDLKRANGRHLAFGMGAHMCLGTWLARLEARITLEQVLKRMPDFHIDVAGCRRGDDLGLRNHWQSMPASARG